MVLAPSSRADTEKDLEEDVAPLPAGQKTTGLHLVSVNPRLNLKGVDDAIMEHKDVDTLPQAYAGSDYKTTKMSGAVTRNVTPIVDRDWEDRRSIGQRDTRSVMIQETSDGGTYSNGKFTMKN